MIFKLYIYIYILMKKEMRTRVKRSSKRIKKSSKRIKKSSNRIKKSSNRIKKSSNIIKKSSKRIKKSSKRTKPRERGYLKGGMRCLSCVPGAQEELRQAQRIEAERIEAERIEAGRRVEARDERVFNAEKKSFILYYVDEFKKKKFEKYDKEFREFLGNLLTTLGDELRHARARVAAVKEIGESYMVDDGNKFIRRGEVDLSVEVEPAPEGGKR